MVPGLALRFLLFLADFFGAAFFRFLAAFFGSDLLSSWGLQISIDLLYCFLWSIGCYFLGGLLDCLLWCCLSGRSFWGSHHGGSQIVEYSPAGSPGSLAATALMAFPRDRDSFVELYGAAITFLVLSAHLFSRALSNHGRFGQPTFRMPVHRACNPRHHRHPIFLRSAAVCAGTGSLLFRQGG